jgi:hypothetical protein
VTDASTFSGNSPSLSSIVNQAPASFLSNIGAMKKNADKETKSADSAVTDMKDIEAKGEKAAAATGALTPPNLQPFNPPQGTDPVKAFGSTASILAVFGGLLTKRPLTTSLNAVAGVVNAYKRNDAAAADAAFKEWKVNTDNAIKLHEFQMDAYKQIMDSTSMSLREKEAEVSVTAHALGDSNSALIAENQGLAGFVDHFDKMQGQGAKLAEDKIKLEGLNEIMKAGVALKAAQKSGDPAAIATAQQASDAAREDYKKMLQSTDTTAMIAADKANVPTLNQQKAGLAASIEKAAALPDGPEKNAALADIDTKKKAISEAAQAGSSSGRSAMTIAINKYRDTHPNADSATLVEFGAEARRVMAAEQSFATGKQGDSVRFISNVVDHISTLMDLSEQLDNGGVKAFNKLKNSIAEETGQAAPTNFTAAKQIVGQEIVKAIIGSGAGGVGERANAGESISRDLSNGQYEGAKQTYFRLLGSQLKGLKRQYTQATSMSPKFRDNQDDTVGAESFDSLLSPEAIDALESNGGVSAGPKVGAIEKGHRFKGGDPSDPSSWEKVQ